MHKENKKMVDQQIKYVKELQESCQASEVSKDKQIPSFKWSKIESTDQLWLNYVHLEVLNKINDEYLMNENIDKKGSSSGLTTRYVSRTQPTQRMPAQVPLAFLKNDHQTTCLTILQYREAVPPS